MGNAVQMVEEVFRVNSRPAKDNDTAPLRSGGRSRAKVKRFMKEKGPEIAKAAITLSVLVLNVVTFCC